MPSLTNDVLAKRVERVQALVHDLSSAAGHTAFTTAMVKQVNAELAGWT
jgi:hypothetical protein